MSRSHQRNEVDPRDGVASGGEQEFRGDSEPGQPGRETSAAHEGEEDEADEGKRSHASCLRGAGDELPGLLQCGS